MKKTYRIFIEDKAEQSVTVKADSVEDAKRLVQVAIDETGDPWQASHEAAEFNASDWCISDEAEADEITPDEIA